MRRFRRALFVAFGCSLLLGLGTPASAAEVGPVEGGNVTINKNGVVVGETFVDLGVPGCDPANDFFCVNYIQTGPIEAGTKGASVAPSVVCLDEHQLPVVFGGETVCTGVYQEGIRVRGTDVTLGGTTVCYYFFPPGIFCQAETGFIVLQNGRLRVEETAVTGTVHANQDRASIGESSECLEVGNDLVCLAVARVATSYSGAQTTTTHVCLFPEPNFIFPALDQETPAPICASVEGEKLG